MALYLLATAATALSWSAWSIPALVRGRINLAINAAFWIGAVELLAAAAEAAGGGGDGRAVHFGP